MKSVYCLNPISNAGMSRFDDTYCIADSIENADAVLLRSASMHEMTLPDSLHQSYLCIQGFGNNQMS